MPAHDWFWDAGSGADVTWRSFSQDMQMRLEQSFQAEGVRCPAPCRVRPTCTPHRMLVCHGPQFAPWPCCAQFKMRVRFNHGSTWRVVRHSRKGFIQENEADAEQWRAVRRQEQGHSPNAPSPKIHLLDDSSSVGARNEGGAKTKASSAKRGGAKAVTTKRKATEVEARAATADEQHLLLKIARVKAQENACTEYVGQWTIEVKVSGQKKQLVVTPPPQPNGRASRTLVARNRFIAA